MTRLPARPAPAPSLWFNEGWVSGNSNPPPFVKSGAFGIIESTAGTSPNIPRRSSGSGSLKHPVPFVCSAPESKPWTVQGP